MDKDRQQMTETILNFTLEIIYLLTGEDYIVVKKRTEEGEGWSRNQVPITMSPPQSLIHKRDQEILDLTNKITELLTGEVPIRCQDAAVYFTMEEWEYLKGQKDHYKDVMTGSPASLCGSSKEETPERCPSPLYTRNDPEENQNVLQDYQHNIHNHFYKNTLSITGVEALHTPLIKMSQSSQWVYSAEEAFVILAPDSESAGEGEEEIAPFLLTSSSSSSSSSSSDQEPPQRRLRTSAQATPQMSDTIWKRLPDNYEPHIPDFTGSSGIRFETAGLAEIDFFQLFFSEDFVNLMVAQTNLYAYQFLAQNPMSSFAMWIPIEAAEMMTFWGLVLHMGLVKKPEIRQYWSADILYSTPLYRMAMTRTRFEIILKFLHYNDNAQCPPSDDPAYDGLFKIRPVIDHFCTKFQEAYTPEKNIAINESLVHFKGRQKFCQYLPSKRARYRIKMYKLCESSSGYTYRFRVYEGEDTRIEPPECPPVLGVGGKIVWDLMHPLLDQGYHLYVDNFYTSIPLFKCLSTRSTAACGTVRKNQRGLSKNLIGQPLRKGESRALHSDNLLLVKYKNKKDVLMLTTMHGSGSPPVRGSTTKTPKPDCILGYNKYMGRVDLSDQVLKPYSAMRKTKVWYKKLAVHVVQMALYNAYVLYQCAGRTGTFLQFQEAVIKALVFGNQEGEGPITSICDGPRIVPGQHFPGAIPSTGKKGRTQKRCKVCYKRGRRRDTTYHCETCPNKPGLCMKECFKIYHTSMDF